IMTIYIKGNKARMEVSSATQYQVIDMGTRTSYVLDSAKKQGYSMSMDMMKSAGGMMGMMGKDMKTSVQKTGVSKTVNGFKCDEYIVTISGGISMTQKECMSQDVNTKEFEPMKNLFEEWAKMLNVDPSTLPHGLPVESEMKMNMMGQEMTGTTEV